MYEATLKNGRALLEKSQTVQDRQHLESRVSELRDSWDTITGKSMERSGNSFIFSMVHSAVFDRSLILTSECLT